MITSLWLWSQMDMSLHVNQSVVVNSVDRWDHSACNPLAKKKTKCQYCHIYRWGDTFCVLTVVLFGMQLGSFSFLTIDLLFPGRSREFLNILLKLPMWSSDLNLALLDKHSAEQNYLPIILGHVSVLAKVKQFPEPFLSLSKHISERTLKLRNRRDP